MTAVSFGSFVLDQDTRELRRAQAPTVPGVRLEVAGVRQEMGRSPVGSVTVAAA